MKPLYPKIIGNEKTTWNWIELLQCTSKVKKSYQKTRYLLSIYRRVGEVFLLMVSVTDNRFTWITPLSPSNKEISTQKISYTYPPKIFWNQQIFHICLKKPVLYAKKRFLTLTRKNNQFSKQKKLLYLFVFSKQKNFFITTETKKIF